MREGGRGPAVALAKEGALRGRKGARCLEAHLIKWHRNDVNTTTQTSSEEEANTKVWLFSDRKLIRIAYSTFTSTEDKLSFYYDRNALFRIPIPQPDVNVLILIVH